MADFIKVTEIRTVRNDGVCTSYHKRRFPMLVNVDNIMTAEDNLITVCDFKIHVEETLEQIEEQLKDITK